MATLDDDDAIRLGGWDARYARVLATVANDDIAGALVDPNGDDATYELDLYTRENDAWVGAGSCGVGSGPPVNDDAGSTAGVTFTDDVFLSGMTVTFGRTRPGGVVDVRHGDDMTTVTANDRGWWMLTRTERHPIHVEDDWLPPPL